MSISVVYEFILVGGGGGGGFSSCLPSVKFFQNSSEFWTSHSLSIAVKQRLIFHFPPIDCSANDLLSISPILLSERQVGKAKDQRGRSSRDGDGPVVMMKDQ